MTSQQKIEAAAAALFQLLKSKLGAQFITIGRKHVMPPTLTAEMQPALFVLLTSMHQEPGKPLQGGKLTLHVDLWGYVTDMNADGPAGEETQVLSTDIHALIAAVYDALAPDPVSRRQTLGGLVQHCWVEGEIFMDPGFFGRNGLFSIPVKVLVP